MPRGTLALRPAPFAFRVRDCHPLRSAFPAPFRYPTPRFPPAPQPRGPSPPVWAAPLSLATTCGMLSFPPGTKMFQFPGFPPAGLWVHPAGGRLSCGRVSPFGHHRLPACTRLPDAFRSVPRPSSALDAQASPVRLLVLVPSSGDRTPPSFRLAAHFQPIRLLRCSPCGPDSTRTSDLPLIRGML